MAIPTKPLVNPNPEKTFCRRYLYQDLNPNDLSDTIAKFEERIKYWFFKPTKDLIKKNIEANNFFAIIIVCIIIDLLSQYWYGLPSSNGEKYKDFLKIFMRSFQSKIKPPLKYSSYNQKGKTWAVIKLQDYAQAFYHIFRCSLLHNAMIGDCGRISGKSILKKSIKLRSWRCRNKKGREIAVNPILLLKNLEVFFNRYIKKLHDANEKNLRRNFVKKFEWDFGITINLN